VDGERRRRVVVRLAPNDLRAVVVVVGRPRPELPIRSAAAPATVLVGGDEAPASLPPGKLTADLNPHH